MSGEQSLNLCATKRFGLDLSPEEQKYKEQLKDFLLALNHRTVRIIRRSDLPLEIEQALKTFKEKAAKITDEITAKACQIKDGQCIRTRKNPENNTDFCCCNECGWGVGYIKQISTQEINERAKFWDNEKGFHRVDGCALPKEERSITCLYYLCDDAIENISKFELDVLYLIGSFREIM